MNSQPKIKFNLRGIFVIVIILLIVVFGIWWALSQRSKRAQVELWGSSAQAITAQIENSLILLKQKLGPKLTLDIHLVCAKDEKGQFKSYAQEAVQRPEIGRLDIEENKRQLVIKKYWPNLYLDYLRVRNQGQNIYDPEWEKYLLWSGLDKNKISEKVKKEGDELLNKEIEKFEKVKTAFKEKYGQELAMAPVILINGSFYEGTGETMSLASAILKPILRGKRDSLPEEPKIELFRGLITFSWPISYSYASLNECYSPADCNDKPDKNGQCKDMGSLKAHCVYTQPATVDLTVLSSKECLSCAPELLLNQIKRDFKGLRPQEIDIETAEGKKLAESLGITSLPAFIFEPNVQQESSVFQFYSQNQLLQPIGQAGQMALAQVPPQMLLGREKKEKEMQLWIMSYCPYGTLAENKLISQLKKKPGTFTLDIRYIVSLDEEGKITSLHQDKEVEEDKRQLLIKKYYPDKFFDYLLKRNENLEGNWEEVAKALGINVADVNAKMSEAEEMLKQEASLAKELNISASPTYFWENQQYVQAQDLTKISVFSDLNQAQAATESCQ